MQQEKTETLELIRMGDLKVEELNWILYPYIPEGKLTIIQGDPGDGKTTLALQIIARLTRGEDVLDSNQGKVREPVNVIYQTAEDGLCDTILPRLLAAGADCDRVYVINDAKKPLTLLDERLEQAIVKTDAKMVVLDPIQGYLGAKIDMHRANEIRPVMKQLATLAESYTCTIILIGHLNKMVGGKAAYRGLGSIDIPASARSVLLVGRMQDDPDKRVVCQTKSSNASDKSALTFEITEDGFNWLGEVAMTADDLLRGCSPRSTNKLEQAKRFLQDALKDGPLRQKQIEDLMAATDIKDRTLWSAKQMLGVQSDKIGNVWYWRLPDDK